MRLHHRSMSPTDLIAKRAIERQLDYQKKKAAEITPDDEYIADLKEHTRTVFEKLERVTQARTLRDNVLEVGSGAHGHIFFWGAKNGVGVDPLADEYRKLFPVWQDCAKSINAFGENLPFESSAFDLVLSDNVVDHAENPSRIFSENSINCCR